ncbi:MAG: 1-deoxy-D-xylulose-5-phosphate reductoisomerase [Prevotellaceae bacterium]|jgi:1-deoxy-D-xylulose-5-phosphate reductoisomerase|nr:1-deoxy-D-xylulose-5-phosphate reductoisomerase [Prevotellaceae bacterium]
MKSLKRIAILGSTGSIGTQALEVIAEHPDLFSVEILTANSNADLLVRQAILFQPDAVVIANESLYRQVSDSLKDYPIKVYTGADALEQIVGLSTIDIVLIALVGYSGLMPTIRAIESDKIIALANKETLVAAGRLVMNLAAQRRVPIIPVDSEHSAIFQCLTGEYAPIDRIYLTASGGPFLNVPAEKLASVTKEDALKHPRWDMGAKITIDSATMMNKGFEVIEAHWLFAVPDDKIKVVIHPQSIIHSMVQFEDGAIKAQLGEPSMKVPIQYALTYPDRVECNVRKVNFAEYPALTFAEPDFQKFPCLDIAYKALRAGGTIPCIMNAANEVAVQAFLNGKIKYTDIYTLIMKTIEATANINNPSLDDYIATDAEARQRAREMISGISGI